MIIFILLFSIFFYLPILNNPNILLSRGNDLQEFFYPIFYFVKQSLINYHQLPFWNNLFFSGTPLLPDPQSPLFYIPNIIFLITKTIDSGFVISIFIHIFIAGIGMYYLTKNGLNFSKKVSLICAILYIASPKLSGFIEAGHYGLITSWAWLPFAFLITIKLAKKPNLKNSILLSIPLALIFVSHILIFAITIVSISLLYLYLILERKEKLLSKILYFSFAGILTFGLTAITLLPQISWQPETTRNLLLNDPDVYPKWLGIKDFLKASISPIFFGHQFIWNLDTEKTVAIGFLVCIIAFFGFLKLKLKFKLFILFFSFFILLISLNNISPINEILIKQNWYILLRVSTRFWFLITFLSITVAGYGFEILFKYKKFKFLFFAIALLTIFELTLTSWTKILKPIPINNNLAPKEVYEFLSQDKSIFRVFCLTRCLSQRQAAIYGLQLTEGYGTLQQTNYYIQSEQVSQSFYRFRYTLSIPPFEIFEYENLQPYSPELSAYNIKYIISNHILKDKNLKFIKQFGQYLIYENEINQARSNYPIKVYTPNFIQIDTSKKINNDNEDVVLSEVYNKDWKAYLNGKIAKQITQTPRQTRSVKIDEKTKFINFLYQPQSFLEGLILTIITLSLLIIFTFNKFTKWPKKLHIKNFNYTYFFKNFFKNQKTNSNN